MSEYKIDYCHHDSVTVESKQEYIKREDAIEMVLEPLNNIPSADVVEVVRCKDCIYNDGGWCGAQEYGTHHVEDDDYCSYGERKEQEHE